MNADESEAGALPVTRWSLVARAGEGSVEARSRALEELLSIYMPALRAHLMFRMRLPQDTCEDLLQEFVAQKVLARDIIASADKKIGKFRTFLLTSLDRFVLNQIRNEKTYQANKKAVAEHAKLTSDSDSAAAETFDVSWARQVIAQALDRMHQECKTAGNGAMWTIFDSRVLGPLFRDATPLSYETLVTQLELASVKQASNLLVTAKRMYARTLRSVVCQYCDESDVEHEIEELKEILSHARA